MFNYLYLNYNNIQYKIVKYWKKKVMLAEYSIMEKINSTVKVLIIVYSCLAQWFKTTFKNT